MKSAECVCGFRPPKDGNPDCERCQLIGRIDELESLLFRIRYGLAAGLSGPDEVEACKTWVHLIDAAIGRPA